MAGVFFSRQLRLAFFFYRADCVKLLVKNWRQFQHYKDRNPPWIKLHFSLLTSSDWVALDDCSRVLAIVCMLVASKNDGQIDGSEAGLAYLQRVAYLNKKPNLKPLIECGFLESASKPEQGIRNARPETETENLKQKEKEEAPQRSRGSRLQPDWEPDPTLQAWASKERPDLDLDAVIEGFRDFWIAKPGKDGTKLDWPATFRNWVRNQRSAKPGFPQAGSAPRPTIQCRSCGNRVSTWTGHQCDPCWRKSQGMDNPLAGLQ